MSPRIPTRSASPPPADSPPPEPDTIRAAQPASTGSPVTSNPRPATANDKRKRKRSPSSSGSEGPPAVRPRLGSTATSDLRSTPEQDDKTHLTDADWPQDPEDGWFSDVLGLLDSASAKATETGSETAERPPPAAPRDDIDPFEAPETSRRSSPEQRLSFDPLSSFASELQGTAPEDVFTSNSAKTFPGVMPQKGTGEPAERRPLGAAGQAGPVMSNQHRREYLEERVKNDVAPSFGNTDLNVDQMMAWLDAQTTAAVRNPGSAAHNELKRIVLDLHLSGSTDDDISDVLKISYDSVTNALEGLRVIEIPTVLVSAPSDLPTESEPPNLTPTAGPSGLRPPTSSPPGS